MICECHMTNFDVIFGSDKNLRVTGNVSVTALKLDLVFCKGHFVRLSKLGKRLVASGPKGLHSAVFDEYKTSPMIPCCVLFPSCYGDVATL